MNSIKIAQKATNLEDAGVSGFFWIFKVSRGIEFFRSVAGVMRMINRIIGTKKERVRGHLISDTGDPSQPGKTWKGQEKSHVWIFCHLWAIFMLNLWKRYAQKLRSIILLPFNL